MEEQTIGRWIAGIFGLIACACYWMAAAQTEKRDAMVDTPTTPAGQVDREGYFEVKGEVGCDDPLDTPHSDTPSVAYLFQVINRYEETYQDRDGHTRTRIVEEVQHEERKQRTFWIQDASGRLLVNPEGAELDVDVIVSRAMDGAAPAHMGPAPRLGTRRRLIERRRQVQGIELGQWLYAIGPVQADPQGAIMAGKDAEGRPFLLSFRSEEDQLKSFGFVHQILLAAAALAALMAAAGLALDLGWFPVS